MVDTVANLYEQAFGAWLGAAGLQFASMDESRRALFGRVHVKTFDYLVYAADGRPVLVEVKGRRFTGDSLEGLRNMQCWVTADDVDALAAWDDAFDGEHEAVFVFAYQIENIDTDLDGRTVFEFAGCRYLFLAVRLADYCRYMKLRSIKWRTVMLPAQRFRQCAIPVEQLLL